MISAVAHRVMEPQMGKGGEKEGGSEECVREGEARERSRSIAVGI